MAWRYHKIKSWRRLGNALSKPRLANTGHSFDKSLKTFSAHDVYGHNVLDEVSAADEASLPPVDVFLGDALELRVPDTSTDLVVTVFQIQRSILESAPDGGAPQHQSPSGP